MLFFLLVSLLTIYLFIYISLIAFVCTVKDELLCFSAACHRLVRRNEWSTGGVLHADDVFHFCPQRKDTAAADVLYVLAGVRKCSRLAGPHRAIRTDACTEWGHHDDGASRPLKYLHRCPGRALQFYLGHSIDAARCDDDGPVKRSTDDDDARQGRLCHGG